MSDFHHDYRYMKLQYRKQIYETFADNYKIHEKKKMKTERKKKHLTSS